MLAGCSVFFWLVVVVCSLALFCCVVYHTECDGVSQMASGGLVCHPVKVVELSVARHRESCYRRGSMQTVINISLHNNQSKDQGCRIIPFVSYHRDG